MWLRPRFPVLWAMVLFSDLQQMVKDVSLAQVGTQGR